MAIIIAGGIVHTWLERTARSVNNQELAAIREALQEIENRQKQIIQRLENVETIVTSEMWDTLPEESVHTPVDEPAKQAAHMAQKLRSS